MAADLTEKESVGHQETMEVNRAEAPAIEVPLGYFRSSLFIGTVFGCGFGFVGGTGSFALPASVLANINNDIGPDPNYFWIGLVNTLMLAVGFTLIGRITDIFGRRYFIVGGNILALVGTILASQARSVNMLIGANVLIGLGAAVQTSVPFVLGELVPLKHRYLVGGLMYGWSIPTAAFGPAIAWAFVLHTAAGWRWCYYLMTITNALSALCWFFFYHPPTFKMKNARTRLEVLKSFDWVGLFLFTGGLSVFLIGLSWGGSTHPWDSAYVIATIVCGACALIAFVLYECFTSLEDPLIPMHLFRNLGWVVNVCVMSLAASCYYGFSIVFPQMVFGIYTADLRYGSYLACAAPASFLLGVMFAGSSRYIGRQKRQVVITSLIATPLLGAIACVTVDNKSTVLGLIIVGGIFIGYTEGVAVTSSGISIKDQAEIGAAVGVASTFRATWATIATTIYLVVLQNRLTNTVPQEVVPALLKAGLPAASIESFIAAISTGSFASVPRVTPAIIEAGMSAYKQALVLAFRTVFYTALALLLANSILTLFFPNLDHKMTGYIAAKLHNPVKLDTQDKLNVGIPIQGEEERKLSEA